MKFLSRAFFAVTFFVTTLLTTSTYAQSLGIHYGPRSFSPAPIGTNAINIQYEHLNAGIYNLNLDPIVDRFNIETNSVMISYTHYFDFFGKTASVVASIPYVKLKTTLKLPGGDVPIERLQTQGITDPYFQFYTPLIGGDALDIQSYVRKEPGFIVGIFAAVRPPLGEYDKSKDVILNPGTNRWEWRMGLPIQYIVGLPTRQTSFEFVPTVYFFGDNDEVHSGQEPLFQLEAHLTHDLNQMFWGSLNVMYAFGGEGTLNGVGEENEFDILGGGATLGARLPHSFGFTVTLGTSLRTKNGNEDGNWIRASLTKNF